MAVNDAAAEAPIASRLRRPLAAIWISLGLHVALIALVQVAPPGALRDGEPVIEARLVPAHPPSPADAVPAELPQETQAPALAPSETAEPLPVAPESVVEPAPPAAAPEPAAPPAEIPPAAAPAPEPGVTITSPVDLTYYGVRDLDVPPRALREIVPDYPVGADRQRLSGKVRLALKLEADGRVSDVEIVSATPPGVFDDSAIRAFRDARFAPAQRNGRPVRARVLIEVEYDWEGRR